MNVFLSHKREDSRIAVAIGERFRVKKVAFYLDVFDPLASQKGDELGDHLRKIMGVCTHLMAVVSETTRDSWWVPWEIGVATEKEFPISTFASGHGELPTYLKKWPYLTQLIHVDTWVDASRQAETIARTKTFSKTASEIRGQSTREYYARVRQALGQ